MKLEDIKIVDQNLMSNVTDYDDYSKLDIAIIGMAFEFPQANRACGHFFRPLCLYSFYNLED